HLNHLNVLLEISVFKFFGFYLLTFNYMQLKIVVLSGGSVKWCFDRLESDMMIFCEWLVEGINAFRRADLRQRK
ncbi:MAG: hypothetical protein ACXQT5_08515, partial [Candidatus Syntropharchaeia archaeon]